MPKVSVIIPVYGVEKYIERCARSLFEQTLNDIEYLFIDDCTPDRSIEILNRVLDEYPQRKNQVIIHRMEKNSGQAAVRKWGMLNATGNYVIHCDSDDWVDVSMYEKMYNKAIEEGSDVVVCDYVVTDGEKVLDSVKGCGDTDVSKFIQRLLFQRDPWSLWNKLFKRTVCSKDLIYPEGNMGEDMVLSIQSVIKCHKISYINQCFYFYYYNLNSISKKRDLKSTLNLFFSLKKNTDTLLQLFDTLDFKYGNCCIKLKYEVKALLHPFVYKPDIYKLWKETYFDVKVGDFFNAPLKIDYVIRYLLVRTRIYGIILILLRK